MKIGELWNSIDGIGDLYLEEYLVYGMEPILFVCNKTDCIERFLVMTYDWDSEVFVIAKVNTNILMNMLNNYITMEEAFRSSHKIILTGKINQRITCSEYNASEFDSSMLPNKGEYYDLKLDYIDDYIDKLRHEPEEIIKYDYKVNTKQFEERLDYKVNILKDISENLPYSPNNRMIIQSYVCTYADVTSPAA